MTISKKRQLQIANDADTVRLIYEAACKQFGVDAVHKDLTRIWDMRAMWGMKRIVPFGAMVCKSLSEVLWVAENVCGIKRMVAQ